MQRAGRTRRTKAIVVAGIGLGIALAAGPAKGAASECPYGVNAHQASNDALDLVAAAGIAWVRFDMNWLQFEPAKGSYDWTVSDRFVDHATSLGLHVFVTIAYSPSWAVAQPCNDADDNPVNRCLNRSPTTPSDWTDFVTAAVGRYGNEVKAWGMWNEPNLLNFYQATRAEYVADILVPGSAAVHSACADCLVLGPELANLRGSANWDADEGQCIAGSCRFNGWNYSLIQILQAAAGSIDVVTHHKYTDPATAMWDELTDGTFEILQVADGVKPITDQYAPGKPVWITEFGWESEPYGGHSNDYAAAQLTASYEGFWAVRAGTQPGVDNQPWPELQKLFWYDLHDDPNGYSWGLLDASLGTKAPYDAYAAAVALVGCPSLGGSGGGGGSAGGNGPSGGAGTGAGGQGATGGAAAGGQGTGVGGSAAGAQAATPSPASSDEGGCGCRITGDGRSPEKPRPATGSLLGLLLAAVGATARRRGTATR